MEDEGLSKQQAEKTNHQDNESNEKETQADTGEVSSQVTNQEGTDQMTEQTKVRYNRLKLFDKVMQTSLKKLIEIASDKGFPSTFRPLYKINPQMMEDIHKQFTEELEKSIQEDVKKLSEEGMLEFKLNELDTLEDAAKNNLEPAWRPSGNPEQDFSDFLAPLYQKQKAFLKLELKKIQTENAALAQKVLAGRENITQTEQKISKAVEEWKTTVTEFKPLASPLCPADVFDV